MSEQTQLFDQEAAKDDFDAAIELTKNNPPRPAEAPQLIDVGSAAERALAAISVDPAVVPLTQSPAYSDGDSAFTSSGFSTGGLRISCDRSGRLLRPNGASVTARPLSAEA